MIGLSSSYYAFRGKGIYDSVKSAFGLGFDTVELGAGHSFEKDAWKTVRKIRHDFPDKNFTVHALFPPLKERYWFNPTLGLTKKNLSITDNLFKAAEMVEAKVVGVHPGFLNEMGFSSDKVRGFDIILPGEPLPVKESWDKFMKWCAYANSSAKEAGVKFALENIHGSEAKPLVFSVQDFKKVFARFPEMGMLLDYGHALFEGLAGDFISKFNKKIFQVHMHWSRARSKEQQKDDHAPITRKKQLEPFRRVERFRRIPVIFEHSTNVSKKQVLAEKKLLEEFEGSF
jgi:sugar phosphate isomerase/epimerase